MFKGRLKFFLPIITGLVLVLSASLNLSRPVQATQVDECNEVFEYPTKPSDFDDARININYHDSDQQIDVSAHSGYQITEVALEVPDDGFSGFHVYATGPITNFNPPGSHDITGAKVKVKKVCATPTPTPTPTPNPCDNQLQVGFWDFLNIDVEAHHYDPTPTPCPTPTPTPEPCDNQEQVSFWNNLFNIDVQASHDEDPTPTPCPTPTPTPTPEPTPSTPPIGGGETVGGNITTPQCPTDRPQQVDQVWFTDVKPGEVTVNWANKGDAWGFQIAYGPTKDNLIWGVEVSDSNATHYTLKDLQGGDLWVSVIAKSSKECGGPKSDPKVVGQVLGASVLGATGNSKDLAIFLSGFSMIALGLWQAQKSLSKKAARS